MAHDANAILTAYNQGVNDKQAGKGLENPFKKNSQRVKHKAYHRGYNEARKC